MNVFHPHLVLAFKFAVARCLSTMGIDRADAFKAMQTEAFHLGRIANLQSQVINLRSNDFSRMRSPRIFQKVLSDSFGRGFSAVTLERLYAPAPVGLRQELAACSISLIVS